MSFTEQASENNKLSLEPMGGQGAGSQSSRWLAQETFSPPSRAV